MKLSLYLVVALVALTLTAPQTFAQPASAKAATTATGKVRDFKTAVLKRADVDKLLAQPEKLVIIDVRRPDELTKNGGFPVYLSIQVADLERSLAYIPKDRSVLTVSNHAGRAGRIGDILTAKGFKVVGAVGAHLYEQEGGRLSKIAVPPPKKS